MAALIIGLAYAAELTINVPLAAPVWLKVLEFIGRPFRAGLPRPVIHVLFLLAAVALAYLAVAALIDRRHRRTLEAAVAPTVAPPASSPSPPEPRASAEAVERLREAYAPWRQCIKIALGFLDKEICRRAENWTTEDPEQTKNGIIATLVRRCVIPVCESEYRDFDLRLQSAGNLSRSEFLELGQQFKRLVTLHYSGLVHNLLSEGSAIVGLPKLLRAESYIYLYNCHQDGIQELRRIRSRSDIGHVAEELNDLIYLLQEPRPRDPGQVLTEDPHELMRMAMWEGSKEVVGRKWTGNALITRTTPPSAHTAERLFIQCELTDSRPGSLNVYVPAAVDAEALRPGTLVRVEGTIAGLTHGLATLWPAEVLRVGAGEDERLDPRHWTSAGLTWRLIRNGHQETGGVRRPLASLVIEPVAGSELPQPLELIVTCAGDIHDATPTYRANELRPDDHRGSSSDIEPPEITGKTVRLKLLSPKLLPPALLDVWLVSEGDAKVEVLDVKRRLQ